MLETGRMIPYTDLEDTTIIMVTGMSSTDLLLNELPTQNLSPDILSLFIC